MKSDLATSAIVFIIGIVISYFAGSMFFSAPTTVNIKSIETSTSYSTPNINNEIFNYRAINPTVEAWIGECTTYDTEGNCLDTKSDNPEEEAPEENPEENPEEETPEENPEENPEEENPEEETPEENPEENENGETD